MASPKESVHYAKQSEAPVRRPVGHVGWWWARAPWVSRGPVVDIPGGGPSALGLGPEQLQEAILNRVAVRELKETLVLGVCIDIFTYMCTSPS